DPAIPHERLFASPLVRKLARERGIDLSRVSGTGPGGRIVRRDLERLEAAPAQEVPAEQRATTASPEPQATPPAPAAGPSADGAYTDVPHTGMRRAIARRLTESKSTVPHFYLVADCRMDALLALRKQINE